MYTDHTDELTSDEGKRRREEEEEEVFRKTKRVMRTPNKNARDENKIDKLTMMMTEIMKDIKEVKQNQKMYQEELVQVRRENQIIKNENEKIKREMRDVRDQMERMQKERVRNNIIVSGIHMNMESGIERKSKMERFIKDHLGETVEIKDVRKIGEMTCKIELQNSFMKEQIMKNKMELKNLKEKVFFRNELTRNELDIQKKIVNMVRERQNDGKKVIITYQKVFIDGKEWRWDIQTESLVEKRLDSGMNEHSAKN